MKLVIAILGLLGTLAAQVICYPVGSKGNLDLSLESKRIARTDYDQVSDSHLFTDYSSRRVRCFEHVGGTLALGNGKIVHSFYVEIAALELRPEFRWSGSLFCPTSRSREWLAEFSTGHLEWPRTGTDVKRGISVANSCGDNLATSR